MAVTHTKLFRSNRSQAVRLAKEVALPDSIREVDIIAIGNKRIITPCGESWDDWFDGPRVTDDFMVSREQPKDQDRESF
jgi:antitoxin VapB